MSNECHEMIQYCERIRNEIFRHLTIISNWRQTSTSLFFVIIAIFIALLTILDTLVYRANEEFYYIAGTVIIFFLSFILIMIAIRLFLGKPVLPFFSSRDYKYHEEAIKKHMKKLVECCSELNKNCDKNFVVPCLDLEDLKMITNYEAKARQDNYKEIIS